MADSKSTSKANADQMKDPLRLSRLSCLESFFWTVAKVELLTFDVDRDKFAVLGGFQLRTKRRVDFFSSLGDCVRV